MHMTKTVIFIDDDQDDLDIITDVIHEIGESILPVVFKDPEKASHAIITERNVSPQHIFIDNNMPRITGEKLLAEIRNIRALDHVTVTMLCTSISSKEASRYRSSGANFTFEKPMAIHCYHKMFKTVLALNKV
jgi:CheY-like chemotaxis protein